MSGMMWMGLWVTGLVCLGAGSYLAHRLLRVAITEPGTCGQCGYDLTGLDASALCPECGVCSNAALSVRRPSGSAVFFPPLAGFVFTQAVALISFGGMDSAGFLFSAGLIAGSFASATTLLAILRSRLTVGSVVAIGCGSSLATALVNCLLLLDAGLWHPDAQGGLVFVVLPFMGTSAAGYGWLGVVLLLHRMRR